MSQKRIEFISIDEFKKLYKAEKRPEMKLMLLLGFGAGLRISEIIGLEEEMSPCCNDYVDVKRVLRDGKNLKRRFCRKCGEEVNIAHIGRMKGKWKIKPLTAEKIDLKKHQIMIDEAKGGKWRITIAPPGLTEKHLKLLPIKINRRTAQKRFEVLAMRVLKKKMSFHILRHGFGNHQFNDLKLPPTMVQQMMGHSRLDTTGIYAKANPEQTIREAWKAMIGE